MKVVFDRGALADLSEILDYIAERNPYAAESLSYRFDEAADLLSTMPDMGTPAGRKGHRRLVVGNYLMVYEVRDDGIIIRFVRHGARLRPWEGEI